MSKRSKCIRRGCPVSCFQRKLAMGHLVATPETWGIGVSLARTARHRSCPSYLAKDSHALVCPTCIDFQIIYRTLYVRILGALYLRLVGKPTDVYQYLEPLYNDYRKLRRKLADGSFALSHVDELIDELLTTEYACDVALPRVPKRWTLEASGQLEPRRSALEDDFEEEEEKEEEDHTLAGLDSLALDKNHRRGRSSPRDRDRVAKKRDMYRQHRDRNYDRDYDYDRSRGKDRDRDRDRDYYRDRDRLREGRDHLRERDREYHRREREKERDRHWDRERCRSRSRSCSRSRDRRDRDHDTQSGYKKRHRSASPQNHKRMDKDALEGDHFGGRDEQKKKKKEKKEKKEPAADGTDHPDPEIAEANRLRAALGLKPLKL